MLVVGVVLYQGLHGYIAVGIAVPVGSKTTGHGVVAILAGGELSIATVESVGLPAGIGAIEFRIIFQHIEQNGVELITADLQHRLAVGARLLTDLKGMSHGASGIEGDVELGLDLARLVPGQIFQLVKSTLLLHSGDPLGSHLLSISRRDQAVSYQGAGCYQQTGPGDQGNL